MDYRESLEYINSIPWFGQKPGLERIVALLKELGNPQAGLKFIHVAGTNGKGSFAAMTASVMKAAGYKTGLFTSPYLYRFNERMQINGKDISDEALAALMSRVKSAADALEDHPTVFELITAAAMLWFSEELCGIVVLEAGMGGRDDATNVIPSPELAVIMNIGLDHTDILGESVESIAINKAGIIKPGCDCVMYSQSEPVERIVSCRCSELGCNLHKADFPAIKSEFDSLEGQAFSYKGNGYAIPLLGAHQRRNAAVVIEAVEALRTRGWKINQADLEHGMYSVFWPARFEILSDEPYFVLDGGHNPQCASTLVECITTYFPNMKRIMLAGVLKDKDYKNLFRILNLVSDEYICVTPKSGRALDAGELGEYLKTFGKPVTVCDSIEDGVFLARERAEAEKGMAYAAGSLYMCGRIRECFGLY